MPTQISSLRQTPDFNKSYSGEAFEMELGRVHAETAIEREWIAEAGLKTYETDKDILTAAHSGKFARVGRGAGYLAIDTLLLWTPQHSDPDYEYHYSPPFLRHDSLVALEKIASDWQEEMGASRKLSLTSVVRSDRYMSSLRRRPGALTIMDEDLVSSHQVGLAFDLDGCGLIEVDDEGNTRKINPRYPGFKPELAHESAIVLKAILRERYASGALNYVEEFAGSDRHCFHICPLPSELQ